MISTKGVDALIQLQTVTVLLASFVLVARLLACLCNYFSICSLNFGNQKEDGWQQGIPS